MALGLGSDAVSVGQGGSGGDQLGPASTSKIGFYGATPVVIRPFSGAVHATSSQAVSASFGATQLASLQEIQKTLIGLGLWATA